MEILELPLDDLVLDPNLNLRDRLDDFTVERYAESWQRLPPITVWDVDGQLLLADGFHRHAAAVMLGKRTIRAEVRHGTMPEALDYVSSVNLFHGLPLTRLLVQLIVPHLGVEREFLARTRLERLGGAA